MPRPLRGAMTDELREVRIYQSTNRPNLLIGCDRELVLLLGLLCAALVLSVATIWAAAVGAATWAASVSVLSRMAKVDPLLRSVYIRHVRYASFYPAKSGLRASVIPVPRAWR